MALQLILGGSGYGKSRRMYKDLIRASIEHPQFNYMIIVPEQYTLQVQKKIVQMHPNHGMRNIDVVSFVRLAHRVFEELGTDRTLILEDIGKMMVLRRIIGRMAGELSVFKGNVRKQGFTGEMKSTISELLQYHVDPKQLADLCGSLTESPLLSGKLKDIGKIYEAFCREIEQRYITAEELLDRLTAVIFRSALIKNSYIYIDEFTGFTPSQYALIGELLKYSKHIQAALTADPREELYHPGAPFRLFYLTKNTVYRLEKLCASCHIDREEDIILRSAHRFGPHESLAFMERYIYRNHIHKTYSGQTDDIHLISAKNPSDEIRCICQHILRLCREGCRFKDMAVITGDLSVYGHVIEQGFKEAGIPYFIDSKKSILSNCLVEFVRALLEVIRQDFNYESIFRFLKSGLTDIPSGEIDILENYVLATGIRGKRRWQEPFERRYKGMADGELIQVNAIREKVLRWIGPVQEAFEAADHTAGSFCRILLDYLEFHGMEERIDGLCRQFEEDGELALAKEYSQIYKIVEDILTKMKDILGEETMTVKEFSDILDSGLDEAKVGIIPPGIDQVIVGDLKRTRLDSIRVLFFAGLNEGIVPGSIKEGGLINDMDKEILAAHSLELAPTGKQEACTEQFYIYTMLSKPSQELYMSFSRVDEHGKSLRPSSLIGRVCRLFEKLEIEETSEKAASVHDIYGTDAAVRFFASGLEAYKNGTADKVWQQLYLWMRSSRPEMTRRLCDAAFMSHEDDRLSKAVVRALYGHVLENSATTLEQYAACAYAHFLTYGLMLRERREYRIEAPDLGILFHSALELFSKKLAKSGRLWHELEDSERDALARLSVDEAAAQHSHTILQDNYRNQFLLQRLTRMVKRTVWALQKQLQKGKFEPAEYELRFDADSRLGTVDIHLSDDEVLKLKGTIDRLDQYEDDENIYVKIIDYKSGTKKFDLTALYYGLQLQLIIYMDAAMALKETQHHKRVIPAGILYYHIDDPLIQKDSLKETEDLEALVLKALRMNGLVNEDMSVIRLMDAEFEKESDVIPAAVNKDGSLSKKSSTASTVQFNRLFKFVQKTSMRMGKQILDGCIDVNPYKRGSRGNACTYCKYRAVCGFDESVEGYQFRHLMEMSAEKLWETISKEVAADGHDVD